LEHPLGIGLQVHFVRSGANLSTADKARLRRMNEAISALYLAWRGRPPDIEAKMKYRELTPGAAAR
jgi:Zn-dependent oligopeptidase